MKQLVAAIALMLTTTGAAAADVSGAWTVQGEVANTAVEFACSLKQADDKLTGTANIQGQEIAITGTVKDQSVTLIFDVEYQGATYSNVYKGTLRDGNVIEGTIEVAGQLGSFAAKKQSRAKGGSA